jgi:hypothetical protein
VLRGWAGEVSKRICAASLTVRRNDGLAAPDAESGRQVLGWMLAVTRGFKHGAMPHPTVDPIVVAR